MHARARRSTRRSIYASIDHAGASYAWIGEVVVTRPRPISYLFVRDAKVTVTCGRRSGLTFDSCSPAMAVSADSGNSLPKRLLEVLRSAKETIPTDRHGLNNDLVQQAKDAGLHEGRCKCSKQAFDRLLARVDCVDGVIVAKNKQESCSCEGRLARNRCGAPRRWRWLSSLSSADAASCEYTIDIVYRCVSMFTNWQTRLLL